MPYVSRMCEDARARCRGPGGGGGRRRRWKEAPAARNLFVGRPRRPIRQGVLEESGPLTIYARGPA
jgi:hypothetical protein